MEELRFLSEEDVRRVGADFGTPCYVYDEAILRARVAAALAFPQAFGLTVRYAMKAWPNAYVLRLFDSLGLHFDASSGYEVARLLAAGIAPSKISLSTQELPDDFAPFVQKGVKVNACSLSQLERFGEAFPGQAVGVRFNPGAGSGHSGKVNTGGTSSSFGIWHEWAPQVRELVRRHNLTVERVHTHIGSGSDPETWKRVASLSLALARDFGDVHTLNLGGGYKVGRMSGEPSTDLQEVGAPVKALFEELAAETGRKLHLEIEPGSFLVVPAGALVSRVQDVVSTGAQGHTFYKLDSGMTELLRPPLYGAQHPVVVIPAQERPPEREQAVVVGHCCESGDLITCAPDAPEDLGPRTLTRALRGDYAVIEGCGAYCAAMSAKNYNSFPEAAEVLRRADGSFALIRRRQEVADIWKNEVAASL